MDSKKEEQDSPPFVEINGGEVETHESVKYMLVDKEGTPAGVLQESDNGLLLSVYGSGNEYVVYKLMNKNSEIYSPNHSRNFLEEVNRIWKKKYGSEIVKSVFEPLSIEEMKSLTVKIIDIINEKQRGS